MSAFVASIACSVLLAGTGASADSLLESAMTSDVCGVCHRDIYRAWKSSAHARAMESPVFLATFHQAKMEGRGADVVVCLGCHAPMASVTGDRRLRDKITWEGVNCDYCHSLADVKLTDDGPHADLRVGQVKRGTIREATGMVHEVEYSPLHETSLVCAPCHEYVNNEGTPLMSTFSEWKSSSWAEKGQTCQGCHMSLTKGSVVDPRIKRLPDDSINLHEMPGGHSVEQLLEALSVHIEWDRVSDGVKIDVKLHNKGAGHAVPTGKPGRRVYLEVEVDRRDGEPLREQRIFERTFVGASGQPITREVDYFAAGVKQQMDTRIQPDESRTESFRFAVSADPVQVFVRLRYEHAPLGSAEDRTSIGFFSEKRRL